MIDETLIKAFMLEPSRRPLLSVLAIERAAKIPAGNLSKFLRGDRSLPYAQLQELVNVLKIVGYK